MNAAMRKPAVPHAGSHIRWPGCGFTSATMMVNDVAGAAELAVRAGRGKF